MLPILPLNHRFVSKTKQKNTGIGHQARTGSRSAYAPSDSAGPAGEPVAVTVGIRETRQGP